MLGEHKIIFIRPHFLINETITGWLVDVDGLLVLCLLGWLIYSMRGYKATRLRFG